MNINIYYNSWIGTLTPETVCSYQSEVSRFLDFHGKIGAQILPIHIETYLKARHKDAKPSAIATALAAIKSFLSYIHKNGRVDASAVLH